MAEPYPTWSSPWKYRTMLRRERKMTKRRGPDSAAAALSRFVSAFYAPFPSTAGRDTTPQ